jgi:hypothetical protein
MIPSESGLRPKPTLGSRTRTILCWGGKWPKTRLALLIIDDFLLVAILAMQILEVARLAVDGQGVGLLPFTFIPPIIILVSTHIPTPAWSKGGWARPARPHGISWIGGISFWGLWMIVTIAVKLASYGKVKKLIGEAVYNGVDSKYPYSDRLVRSTTAFASTHADSGTDRQHRARVPVLVFPAVLHPPGRSRVYPVRVGCISLIKATPDGERGEGQQGRGGYLCDAILSTEWDILYQRMIWRSLRNCLHVYSSVCSRFILTFCPGRSCVSASGLHPHLAPDPCTEAHPAQQPRHRHGRHWQRKWHLDCVRPFQWERRIHRPSFHRPSFQRRVLFSATLASRRIRGEERSSSPRRVRE